ncbi:hypothetical protein SH2C18_09680 [Clostridium sediminicola]|uniref:hypothetical protein n=1 Tax=Clostridium sediminicola TaxID=3114879 RepID=UPI0031F238C8
MPRLNNLCYEPRKKIVFNSIDCYEDSPIYDHTSELFEEIKSKLPDYISPTGIYSITDIPQNNYFILPKCYTKVCLCYVSIGHKIIDVINNYFNEAEYLEGMLLDSISDDILFQYSNKMRDHIEKLSSKNNYGLSKRISPGDNNYPMEYTKFIVDELVRLENPSEHISYTDSYMIKPVKSLAFMYGLGLNLKSEKDHDCKSCTNITCKFREV